MVRAPDVGQTARMGASDTGRSEGSATERFDRDAWHRRIREAVQDPERLDAVAATGLVGSELEPLFDRLTELAAAVLGARWSFVTLVDDERSFWKSAFGTGATEASARQNRVEESFCQYVVASGEPLLISDARLDDRTNDNESIESMGVVAWAGSPIVAAEGHVLGTFCVVDDATREWTAADSVVLETLAGAAASEIQLRTALRRSTITAERLAEQLENRDSVARRSQLMTELAQQLSAAASAADVSRVVASTGRGVLDALFVNIDLLDHSATRLTIIHSPSVPDEIVERYSTLELEESTAPGAAILRQQPVFASTWDEFVAQWPAVADDAHAIGLRSAAAWPLFRSDGTVIGALSVGWSEETVFGPLLRAALLTLAQMCSAALERGQADDVRAGFVLALQHALLPAVPSIPGLDLATEYLPANDELGFGGDWYDIFALSPTRTAIVVGDVCGHGISAAATMAVLRGSLNALTRLNADSLATVFDAVEDTFLGSDQFVATVAIHVVDTSTNDLTSVSAGHPPSVIVLPDGRSSVVDGGRRPVLGMGGPIARVDRTSLPPGAVLVAYTDGLVERRGRTIDEGISNLIDVVALARDDTAADIGSAIAVSVSHARTDDVAYVVIKRDG
jgi:GAF domain-containing protein